MQVRASLRILTALLALYCCACGQHRVLVEVRNQSGSKAVSLEQSAWYITQRELVTYWDGRKSHQLVYDGDNFGPCFFAGTWSPDQRYVIAVLHGCEGYVHIVAVDAMTGKQIPPEPFKALLEKHIRTIYRVPSQEDVWQWIKSEDARWQFNATIRHILDKGW